MILFWNEGDETSLSAPHCLCCSCSYILNKVVTLQKQSKEWKLLKLFQSCLMRLYLSPHDLASVITSISALISWGSWSKVRLLPHVENLSRKCAEELGWALRGIVRAELCPREAQHCFPIPCWGCVADIHSLWETGKGNMCWDRLIWLRCWGK